MMFLSKKSKSFGQIKMLTCHSSETPVQFFDFEDRKEVMQQGPCLSWGCNAVDGRVRGLASAIAPRAVLWSSSCFTDGPKIGATEKEVQTVAMAIVSCLAPVQLWLQSGRSRPRAAPSGAWPWDMLRSLILRSAKPKSIPWYKKFNWYSFALYRYKVYDAIWRVSAVATIGACIYLSVMVVQTWNASVHRTWQHYARKEKERAELMNLIREARERGALPPGKAAGFE
eukprot:Skav205866  [mRNA]  locus=scaffold766:169080:172319:+ [translate_table: standard]